MMVTHLHCLAIEAELKQLNMAVVDCYNAGQPEQLAQHFTEDAVLMVAGHDKFTGREGLWHMGLITLLNFCAYVVFDYSYECGVYNHF